MSIVCGVTAGEIRQRVEDWFDWDEVHLVLGKKCFPLELGFNRQDNGYDWTDAADFQLLLQEMGDLELLRFCCNGRSLVVVAVEDENEPFLTVEEV
jgi:hypothetical protein